MFGGTTQIFIKQGQRYATLQVCNVVFCLLLFFITSLSFAADSSRKERYDEAIALARLGNFAEAKKIVSDVLGLPFDAPEVSFDYIVILAQAGKVDGAITAFKKLPPTVSPPPYVVKEVVVCYARQGDYKRANDLYDRYLKGEEGERSGRDAVMDRYLAARRFDLAAEYARQSEKKMEPHQRSRPPPPKPVVTVEQSTPVAAPRVTQTVMPATADELFRQGESFERNKEFIAAYYCYENILSMDPGNMPARNLKYRALIKAGCSSLARDLLERTGDRIDEEILRELMGNEAMTRIRWEEPDAAMRIIAANRRIAEQQKGRTASREEFILRSSFDRIAALKLKGDYRRAVEEVQTLLRPSEKLNPSPFPSWALVDIGQSYLFLGKPQEAIFICNGCRLRREDPVYEDMQMLYYESLVSAGKFGEAHRASQTFDATVPAEKIERGIVRDNRLKEEIARNRGWELVYQDRLDEAERYFTELLSRAPYNSGTRAALAQTYLENDRPTAALEEFAVARSIDTDAACETGYCRALYENARYDEAYALSAVLVGRYPKDKDVQAFGRTLNGPLPYDASIEAGTIQEQPGASEFGTTLKINKPVGYGRNVFGQYTWRHTSQETLSDTLNRAALGMEWRALREWTFTGMLSAEQTGKPGFAGSAAYRPLDTLSLSYFYDSFSMFVPLQARARGVTAREQYAALRLGPGVGTVLEGKFDMLAMSDGNEQRSADLKLSQRVTANERGRLDMALEGNYAANAKTAVDYFSPASLYAVYLVPETEVALFRGQTTTVQGRLGAGLGRQWQEDYSAENLWFIRYEQDHRLPGNITLGAGVSYSLQNYDGEPTDVWNMYVSAGTGF